MLTTFTAQLSPLLQAIPPRVPPFRSEEDGSALIFVALIAIVFFLVAGVIIGSLSALIKAFDITEKAQIPLLVGALALAGATIWFFWDPLRELLTPVAELSWVALILIFGVLLIVVTVAAATNALRSSLSRQNAMGTLSLLVIAAATAYLLKFEGWGFWSALGLSFGVILVLNAIGVAVARWISNTDNK